MKDKVGRFCKSRYSYWCTYSVVFVLMFGLVFINFFLGEYSFVNRIDGLNQQYSSLLYFHRWGQEILNTFMNEGKVKIPIWDINIGLGADLVTTVFYYVGITPITIGAIFLPEAYLEYFYMVDVFFRLYLAGVGFSIYAKHHKNENWSILLGSLCYCFCGFVLQKGIQHIIFLLPMFFLPMILFGIDRIIEGNSSLVFICFTALCAINSFYFFYMIVIAAILYVICQLCFDINTTWKQRIWKAGEIFLYGVIALLIASCVLMPMLYAMLGSSRVGGREKAIPLFYHVSYYYNLVFGCMTNGFGDFDVRTGFAVTVILSVFLLWCHKGEKKLKTAFLGLTAVLCLPLAGSIMNGMGYVSNRWIFIYAFLLVYIFVKVIPKYMFLERNAEIKLILALGIYFLICIIVPLFGISDDGNIYRTIVYLFVIFAGIIIINNYQIIKKMYRKWIIGCTIFSILTNAYLMFMPCYENGVKVYVKKNDNIVRYTEGLASNTFLDVIDEESLKNYRCEISDKRDIENSSMLQKIHAIDYYFSVVIGSINSFRKEMFDREVLEAVVEGYDNRIILNSLAGVKYSLVRLDKEIAENPAIKVINDTEKGIICENMFVLPMVYCYENYIPRSIYDDFSVTDKQEAMLFGAVVRESNLCAIEPELSNYAIDYAIESEMLVEENAYRINDDNSQVVLALNAVPENSEVYVVFENVSYKGLSPMDIYRDVWQEKDWGTQRVIKRAEVMYQEPSHVTISVSMGKNGNKFSYYTPENKMYSGRNNFLCNLGYVEEGSDEITLTFSDKGVYSFSDMRVVVQPIEPVLRQLEVLKENDTLDWNFGCNTMYGSIDCTKNEIMCVTVPYTIGWKAYVDGKEQEIKQVNTAYIGLELTKGHHDIKFVYQLPMGKVGIILSAFGVLSLCVVMIYDRIQKKKNKQIEGN